MIRGAPGSIPGTGISLLPFCCIYLLRFVVMETRIGDRVASGLELGGSQRRRIESSAASVVWFSFFVRQANVKRIHK